MSRIITCLGGHIADNGETVTITDAWQNKVHTMPSVEAHKKISAYTKQWPRCEYLNIIRHLME